MKDITAWYSFTHKRYISFYYFLRKDPVIVYKRSSKQEIWKDMWLSDLNIWDVTEIYILNTDIETIKNSILDFSSFLLEKEIDIIQELYVKYSKFYRIWYSPNFEFQDFTVAIIFDNFKALLFFTKDYLRRTNKKIWKWFLNSIDLFNNKYNGKKIKYYFKIKDKGDIIKNSIVILLIFDWDLDLEDFFVFLEKTWWLKFSFNVKENFLSFAKEKNYALDFSISILSWEIENLYFWKKILSINK